MTDIWVDGRLVGPGHPAVAADDAALTSGHGVFEAVKLTDGHPFALRRHLTRLRASADVMGIEIPDEATIRNAIDAMWQSVRAEGAHSAGRGIARITVTAGRTSLVEAVAAPQPVIVVSWRAWQDRREPARVVTSPWPRNEFGPLVGVKSTSYGEAVVILADARRRGADEALVPNLAGNLCEGTTSNVFVGFDDGLLTPPASAGILSGVTRDLLLEAGVGVEADIPMAALDRATEAFLVSTGREVQPIGWINDRALPSCPGPLTVRAADTWRDRYANADEP